MCAALYSYILVCNFLHCSLFEWFKSCRLNAKVHSHNGRTANMHIAHTCKVFGSGAKKGEESFAAGVSSPQVIITQYTFEIFCSGYVFFILPLVHYAQRIKKNQNQNQKWIVFAMQWIKELKKPFSGGLWMNCSEKSKCKYRTAQFFSR